MALGTFGWALWRNGEEEQAAQVLEESLALARVVGEPWLIAFALMQGIFRVANGAAIEHAAERSRAWAASVEALRRFRKHLYPMYWKWEQPWPQFRPHRCGPCD